MPARTPLRVLFFTAAVCALVASASGLTSRPAAAQEPTIRDLQRRLEERDAVIRDLTRRVEMLEQRSAGPVPAPNSNPPVPNQRAQAPTAPGPAAPAPQSAGAPGQFEISEEAAQHALERALVQTGGLLLPSGTAEFVPGFRYTRREIENPGQIALLSSGQLFSTNSLVRTNELEASALFRFGLPWSSQFEVTLPYDYKSLTTANQVGGAALSSRTTDAWGVGDPAFTFIKQIAQEREWRPSLFASVGWDTNLGQRRQGIALGTGFNEVKGSVLAVKRQDPIVFTGSLGYVHSFEYRGIAPGDQFATALQMFLAVSPETSLRISPQLTFAGDAELNGSRLAGSNQVAGVMTFGALSILAPGVIMDLSTDIGVTRDAPKYAIRASFPIRFGMF